MRGGPTRAVSRANFILVVQYGRPKKCPKKQKVKLLTLTCLFIKRKFKETHKDFSINYPYNSKCGKTLTLLLTKLQNTLAPNSLDKLIQLNSMEPHIYDLDIGKIVDLGKFLKNPHSVVLS